MGILSSHLILGLRGIKNPWKKPDVWGLPRKFSLGNLGKDTTKPQEHAWVQHGDFKGSKLDETRINKELYQLHAATGHGSVRHMIGALQKRGAPEHVMVLARKFTCHVCQERIKGSHKHAATLEPLPPNGVLLARMGVNGFILVLGNMFSLP